MEKYQVNGNSQNSTSSGHSSVSPGELVENVDFYSLPSLKVDSSRIRSVNKCFRRQNMGEMDVG